LRGSDRPGVACGASADDDDVVVVSHVVPSKKIGRRAWLRPFARWILSSLGIVWIF